MSVQTVQTAVLRQLQKNAAIDTEFATVLTGTATSSGTAITGSSTLFTTELKVDDYIGNITRGYRKVTAIADDTNLTVEEAFDTEFTAESIKKTEVKKGVGKNVNVTEVGRTLRVVFVASNDAEGRVTGRIVAVYGFLIISGFFEPNDDRAEDRKSQYDKLQRDAIEADFTFGTVCDGNTVMGKTQVAEAPGTNGIYYGVMPLITYKHETRGAR